MNQHEDSRKLPAISEKENLMHQKTALDRNSSREKTVDIACKRL